MINHIELSQELIRCPSITPKDEGVIDLLIKTLEPLGFKCHKLIFEDVTNLYARLGTNGPNLCFAGHTDVVPVGGKWQYDPFSAIIENDKLYGRGAIDMKPPIAAFISAVDRYKASNKYNGSISLLISGNEEGDATNGTPKVLDWLQKNNEKINDCILGEPTCVETLGDRAHIGRRGSINIVISVYGIQGHVAYQHIADNPITRLIKILNEFENISLDNGNENFEASNLEVVGLIVDNIAFNIIPEKASARINIRFNNIHTGKTLEEMLHQICKNHAPRYELNVVESSDSFISHNGKLKDIIPIAVKKYTGIIPELSTSGGTSDARYISKFCPTLEFGLVDKLAHKVNEHVDIKDIDLLSNIYEEVIKLYFAS